MRGDGWSTTSFDIISENVRLPQMALGDLNAAAGHGRIADRRMQETVAKYGTQSTLAATFPPLLTASEAARRGP